MINVSEPRKGLFKTTCWDITHPLTGEPLGYISKGFWTEYAIHVMRENPPGYMLFPCEGFEGTLEAALERFQEKAGAQRPADG